MDKVEKLIWNHGPLYLGNDTGITYVTTYFLNTIVKATLRLLLHVMGADVVGSTCQYT